jgi:penicillin-binding protein 1A
MPRPESALAATRRPSVRLVASNGALLATEGDLYGELVRLRDLPPFLPAALLVVEDRRFRSHFGLDPVGIARAAWANWRAGTVVQGGSTLTQQLAKNLFLTPERSTRRKVQEALLALWLERRFGKDELLEIYLNRVYLGAGAYGVDAAARLFFGVPARRLQLWQAAMLAGLPKAPSRLNPRASPDLAVARAAEVLDIMVDAGALGKDRAVAELSRIRSPPPPARGAGWFADWALARLADSFPGNADLVLRATLDPRLQAVAEARLEALLAGAGARAGVGQGAVVALDAGTGAVRAMVGGRDYRDSQFNRAADARRQPGSVFKPFVFLAALEAGMRPEEAVADGPLTLGAWSPGNAQWRSRGEVSVEEALAQSVNTAAVRVLLRAGGPRAAIAAARRLGLDGRLPNDASLALGTGEAGLLDLSAAFAAFANGGFRVEPHGIASAATGNGRALPVRRAPRSGRWSRRRPKPCGVCWKRWCPAAPDAPPPCPAAPWRARPAPPRSSATLVRGLRRPGRIGFPVGGRRVAGQRRRPAHGGGAGRHPARPPVPGDRRSGGALTPRGASTPWRGPRAGAILARGAWSGGGRKRPWVRTKGSPRPGGRPRGWRPWPGWPAGAARDQQPADRHLRQPGDAEAHRRRRAAAAPARPGGGGGAALRGVQPRLPQPVAAPGAGVSVFTLEELLVAVRPLLVVLMPTPAMLAVEPGAEGWPVRMDRALLDEALIVLAREAGEALPRGGVLSLSSSNRPGPPDMAELAVRWPAELELRRPARCATSSGCGRPGGGGGRGRGRAAAPRPAALRGGAGVGRPPARPSA